MTIRKLILAAVLIALPAAAQATDLTPEMARYALKMKNVTCNEAGLVTKDGKTLISCTNGQSYAVWVMKGDDGNEFVTVRHFNQLTKAFDPI